MKYRHTLVVAIAALVLIFCTVTVRADRDNDDDDDDDYDGSRRRGDKLRDVCVLGGGPSGLSAAVFAKDRGLDVLVLEREGEYGGNCNTETFTPPLAGAPNWIDIGTAAFPDTTKLKVLNNDTWNVDSVAFAKRFAGNNSIIILDLTNPATATPTYLADFARGFNFGVAQSTPEQQAAFGAAAFRWLGLLKRFPWIQQSNWPSPIPADAVVPLPEVIDQLQLQPLLPLFNQILYGGGFSSLNIPVVYALAALKPSLLYAFITPNVLFSINGGCIKMYDGMVSYLGAKNVILNAEVVEAERPTRYNNGRRSYARLSYSVNQGSRCRYQEVRCKHVVVAFPQTLQSIAFLQPDWKEQAAFRDFFYRQIYTMELNVTGPVANAPSGFTILNFDLNTFGNVAVAPSFAYIQRGLPYGPAQAPLISDTKLSPSQVMATFRAQARSFPAELLAINNVLASDSHDQYFPSLPAASLTQTVNPFKRIMDLNNESYRGTSWVSTNLCTPDTVGCWELSYNTVQKIVANINA